MLFDYSDKCCICEKGKASWVKVIKKSTSCTDAAIGHATIKHEEANNKINILQGLQTASGFCSRRAENLVNSIQKGAATSLWIGII